MNSRFTFLYLFFLVCLLLSSCVPPEPITPTAEEIIIPSDTPMPTVTQIPSSTPIPTFTPPPTSTPSPEIVITEPFEGVKVEQIQPVKGTSQYLPDDNVIWIVIFIPSVGRYFPQNFPADIQANGEWSSVAYIGQQGESGLDADIVAVLANKDAQDSFNAYLSDAKDKNDYPGIQQLPNGAVIYHRRSVVRK